MLTSVISFPNFVCKFFFFYLLIYFIAGLTFESSIRLQTIAALLVNGVQFPLAEAKA